MVLHLLYGQQQLQNCLDLLGADDTLLVMEAVVLEAVSESLSGLPCGVMVLDDSHSNRARNDGLSATDTIGLLDLIMRYPHSLSWS